MRYKSIYIFNLCFMYNYYLLQCNLYRAAIFLRCYIMSDMLTQFYRNLHRL